MKWLLALALALAAPLAACQWWPTPAPAPAPAPVASASIPPLPATPAHIASHQNARRRAASVAAIEARLAVLKAQVQALDDLIAAKQRRRHRGQPEAGDINP